MADTALTKTVFFAASRETVWSFLTDKDKLALWFHRAEADLAPDQDYALVAKGGNGEPVKQCWGRVLEMKPPTSLVYSFTIKPLGGGDDDRHLDAGRNPWRNKTDTQT